MSAEEDNSEPNERIYRELFNNTNDAIFFHEVNADGLPGSFIEVNDVACRMLSYSRDELLHLSVKAIDTKEQWDRIRSLMDILFQKRHHTFEAYLVSREGSSIPCEISAHLFNWKGKNVVLSVARDISDRKKAEQDLRDMEVEIQTLFESTMDGVFVHEIEPSGMPGRFIQVNEYACKMFGYSQEEILSMSPKSLMSRETRKIRIPKLGEMLFRNRHVFYQSEVVRKDGSIFPAEVSSNLFKLQGKLVVLAICRDISKRKKAVRVLRERERKYRALIENANDSIFLFEVTPMNLPGRILEVNPMACSSLMYTREELLSMTLKDILSKERWEHYPEFMKKLQREVRVTFEREQIRKDGKKIPVEVSTYLFHMNNKPVILSFVRDISERKKVEEFLRASEKFSSSLLDNAPHPILVIAPDQSIRYVNKAMEIFTGFSSEELLGRKDPYPWWHRDLIEQTRGYFRKACDSGIERVECQFQKKDKSIIWGEIHAYPVYENDELQFVISNLVDITPRKASEKQLEIYQQKLRILASELDMAEERERKNIADQIHDSIGQTLALLKIKAAMLEDRLSDPESAKGAADIVNDLDRVISFTRDFLFEVSPPILYELGFEAAVRWLRDKMLADHGLKVEFRDDGLAKTMSADKKAFLFRSLRELLMNVIKHSEVGEVLVRSYLDGDQVILEVEDHGSGFEVEEIMEKVGYSESFGLFSIHERVNFLGGMMEICSRRGRGTMVTISLPVDEEGLEGE